MSTMITMRRRPPRHRLHAIRKKLRELRGFTMTELMAATLIMLLVSGAMAGGVTFAVRQYHNSMILSESKLLCSTLSSVVQGELCTTQTVVLSGDGPVYDLERFYSANYAIEKNLSSFLVVGQDDSGELYLVEPAPGYLALGTVTDEGAVEGGLLVSTATYSSYHFKAGVSVRYEEFSRDGSLSMGVFHVTLTIFSSGGEVLLTNEYDVLPLNRVSVDSGDGT